MAKITYCNECNVEITKDDDLFCHKCGHELNKEKKNDDNFSIKKVLSFIGNMLKTFGKGFLNNLYLILLFVSISYFIFYAWLFYLKVANENDLFDSKIISFLKDIALVIFTGGVFTASLKYLAYIKIFEKEFDRILISDKYTDRLKKSIESITLSEDYFLAQTNLEHIWEVVTLSKYRKAFPDIYTVLKRDIKNEFFEKNNIAYYYKNYRKEYFVSLIENKQILVKELTRYTIVKKSKEEFTWKFSIGVDKEDSNNEEFPKISFKCLNVDIELNPETDIKTKPVGNDIIKEVEKTLQGRDEYHIEREVIFSQNLDNDRECIFGCDKIIDDITINIRYNKDLKVIFSPAWKIKYHKQDVQDFEAFNEMTYFNRGLLLPGEKFKLFIIKV
ncbi:zinc ribbon domain-containing protein [Leeuwenhoekiella marinoflava]|uniref:C2H2-type domain-containing protein n=2 Tax=Leeuwenhoekiella marinoflava TaxID=988 RepID=A0A4Q0P3W7_9FLAO|nr:zinc ribbon domain-containing protein [Leeuwenhoekiella marinoflava]RXG21254.1 hypothetical protein DSL99_4059 [Leeuwenhoekiella marinoflava]SHG04793.1 hypothetical protein SAMN02745246_04062 [Leeuwenhoekiella marinoflava DSM 3653]